MRQVFRQFLALLSRLVLWKHQPLVVAVVGRGANAVARELIFQVVNINYPAVQNLQSPKAEFSIPLTVFGVRGYPQNVWQWIKVVAKALLQLLRLQRFQHVLVLELDTVNNDLTKFWINVLQPQHRISTSKLAHNPDLNQYKQIAINLGKKLGIEEEISVAILEDFEPKGSTLKIYKGLNGSIVIDATHHFYPIPMQVVDELLKFQTSRDKDYKVTVLDSEDNNLVRPQPKEITGEDLFIIKGFAPIAIKRFAYLIKPSR